MSKVLVLRTCDQKMQGYGGFQWPESGPVEAPDWKDNGECGNGLHGLLWGEGSSRLLNWEGKWMVVEVDETDVRPLTDNGDIKCKFPKGVVVFVGDREGATGYIHARRPGTIVGLVAIGGDRSTLTGGNCSKLTGGYDSKLTGGNYSKLTGGNCSKLTGGHYSKLTGGYGSTLTGGYGSTLTGGDCSTLTGGYGSTLIFSGETLVTVAMVGKEGIEPNVPYVVRDGKVVRA